MSDANTIPMIDLGPYLAGESGALDRVAAELRHALTDIGFYSIVNHGVPSALVDEVYRQVARFHAPSAGDRLIPSAAAYRQTAFGTWRRQLLTRCWGQTDDGPRRERRIRQCSQASA